MSGVHPALPIAGAKEFTLKRIIALACLLALGACGTFSSMLKPVSPADVAALEEGVTIADTLALNYARLPPCPTTAPVCSATATKQAIKGYAQRAHDAVKTLQASSASDAPAAFSVAQAALAALRASIPAAPAVAQVGSPIRN
jgi:hypothetical protein